MCVDSTAFTNAYADEAISWGKIRLNATPVKVSCDATIAFPLIVSQTFAKDGPKTALKTKPKAEPASEEPSP